MTDEHGPYTVVQFFGDGSCDYALERAEGNAAVLKAKRLTENVAARTGLTTRIIITDAEDYTVFEWKYGQGVTYPTPEMRGIAQ